MFVVQNLLRSARLDTIKLI
uniref:Uncharacterized protein n=1 Tax=Romanomermis culicivorax TaxID=13658 RepID=A0A915HXF0_ROMCU